MRIEEKYMMRCLELAALGHGNVAPNPMVGCVIVHNEMIIGEGYHRKYGQAHAEVNAIQAVHEKGLEKLLPESTLFVNLEPCSHYGKTPPCADLIIKHKIPKVVIACKDSNINVSGKGIEKLKGAGCEIEFGILEDRARTLNKRFFTYHEKKRPYIILKWARSADGYFSSSTNGKTEWISSEFSRMLVHKWRSEESAIMAGTNTFLHDNPELNVRLWKGNDPLRTAIDKDLRLPKDLNLFNRLQPTLIFTSRKAKSSENEEYCTLDFKKDIIPQILEELYSRKILSIIVEGGSTLLSSFIRKGEWDEARIFISEKNFSSGIEAPLLNENLTEKYKSGEDDLLIFHNQHPFSN